MTGDSVERVATMQAIQNMAVSLRSIAVCMEAAEKRAQELPHVVPDDLGALALWREDVASGSTVLGFSEWLAWHVSDDREEKEGAHRGSTSE